MVYNMAVSTLEDVMQMLHTKRQDVSLDVDERRHISVAYTDIEKVVSYIEKYLVERESEG